MKTQNALHEKITLALPREIVDDLNKIVSFNGTDLEKVIYSYIVDGIASDGVVTASDPHPAYYGGIKYAYPHVAPGQPMFSRSAVVGNLIFCSGAAGLALGTFKQASEVLEDQMKITMDKIKMYMEQAGSYYFPKSGIRNGRN